MGHLFPEIPGSPADAVLNAVVFGEMTPATAAALRTEQFLEPLIAEHQHGVGIDHQLSALGRHAALLQLFGLQQVQKVFLPVALNALIRMGGAEEFAALGSAVAAVGVCCA